MAPTALEPPPTPEWIAETIDAFFAHRPGDPAPLFVGPAPDVFHGYPSQGLDGVPSGALEAPLARPCPLPLTAARWRVIDGALVDDPDDRTSSPGWFEGPAARTSTVVVATSCGPGGVSLVGVRSGCALELRSTNPMQPRARLGFARLATAAATRLTAFDPRPFEAECTSQIARAPAVGALRCVRANRSPCAADVYGEPVTLPAERVRVHVPTAEPEALIPGNAPIAPPFPRRWSGLALTRTHVWMFRDQQSAEFQDDCRIPSLLSAWPRAGGAGALDLAAPSDAPCLNELFTRPGTPGFFATARLAGSGPERCPLPDGSTWSPNLWALVQFDDGGRAIATRALGGGCSARLVISEPDAPGPMVFAASESFGPLPRTSWVWTVTPERLEISAPLVVSSTPGVADDPGVELGAITYDRAGLMIALDLQRKRLSEFRVEAGAAPEVTATPRSLPPLGRELGEFPAGILALPDGRLLGTTAGEPASGGVAWTLARRSSPSSTFGFFTSADAPGDILATAAWPKQSWTASSDGALVTIVRTTHATRRSELRWIEVLGSEERVRERPERVDLGFGPPAPRVAIDDRDGALWVLMAWTGVLFRVPAP